MYCVKCGSYNEDGAYRCTMCGEDLAVIAEAMSVDRADSAAADGMAPSYPAAGSSPSETGEASGPMPSNTPPEPEVQARQQPIAQTDPQPRTDPRPQFDPQPQPGTQSHPYSEPRAQQAQQPYMSPEPQPGQYAGPAGSPQAGEYLKPEAVYTMSSTDNGLRLAAFILAILSCVSFAALLLPLAWMIPMTVHTYGIYQGKKPNTVAFGVCSIIFLNVVGGILLLVSKKDA